MFRSLFILLTVIGVHSAAFAEGSADRGMAIFIQNCSACHSIEASVHKAGPSLAGLLGRQAGSAEGFQYSAGLANQDFTWNTTTLQEYLIIPTQSGGGDQLLHSVHMHFEGISSQSAEDLIAFLQAL